MRLPAGFALALALAAVAPTARADGAHDLAAVERFDDHVPGAARLEGRLLAPCCWDSSRQTLDIHGSPVATELRREIRRRLKAGESPEQVEAALVARYTKKILAVPDDSPLPNMGPLLSLGMALGLVGAVLLLRRWRRQGAAARVTPAEPSSAPVKDDWDRRLDAELGQDED